MTSVTEAVRLRQELDSLNQEMGWMAEERNEVEERMGFVAMQIQDIQHRLDQPREEEA
jgi:hypothetical protein